jgi:hypothetical protein
LSTSSADDPWIHLPTVTSVADLERYGTPEPLVRDKVEARLSEVHGEWIAGSPLVFVATSSPEACPPGGKREYAMQLTTPATATGSEVMFSWNLLDNTPDEGAQDWVTLD